MPSKIILIVMAMVIVCMMLFGNKKEDAEEMCM